MAKYMAKYMAVVLATEASLGCRVNRLPTYLIILES